MPPEQLQWIKLNDFSPGIQEPKGLIPAGQGGAVSHFQDIDAMLGQFGAANIANTYRCHSLPTGGLAPLPDRLSYHTIVDPAPSDTFPAAMPGYGVSGFYVAGQISPLDPDLQIGLDISQIYWALEWIAEGTPNVRKYVLYETPLYTTPVFKRDISPDVFGEGVAAIQAQNMSSVYPTRFEMTKFAMGRRNNSAPSSPGSPHIAAAWHERDTYTGFWAIYPDPADMTVRGWHDVTTSFIVTNMWAHQGRWCGTKRAVYSHGAAVQDKAWYLDDDVVFTKVNHDDLVSTTGTTFTQQNATGYGAINSVSSSELFMVRNHGGALVVRGSLVTPSVVTLPYVTPTRGAKSFGCMTPLGFVYPVRDHGVWLWNGGEESVDIAPNLPGDFLTIRDVQDLYNQVTVNIFQPWVGTFAYLDHWVFCPNNWVFDIETGGWWRLENPAEWEGFHFQSGVTSSTVWAAPMMLDHNHLEVMSLFDLNAEAAQSFSWESTPFPIGNTRQGEVRELEVTAHGTGTVTITLTNEAGTTASQALTFSTSGYPKKVRKPIHIDGYMFRLKIVSDGSSDPAPIVHEVAMGVREIQHQGYQ